MGNDPEELGGTQSGYAYSAGRSPEYWNWTRVRGGHTEDEARSLVLAKLADEGEVGESASRPGSRPFGSTCRARRLSSVDGDSLMRRIGTTRTPANSSSWMTLHCCLNPRKQILQNSSKNSRPRGRSGWKRRSRAQGAAEGSGSAACVMSMPQARAPTARPAISHSNARARPSSLRSWDETTPERTGSQRV